MAARQRQTGQAGTTDVQAPTDVVIRALLDQVDQVAAGMERKWGIGELPTRVSADWRDRFQRQVEKLDAAVASGSEVEVRTHAAAMIRAWQKLDALATEGGQIPGPNAVHTVTLAGRVWTLAELDHLVAASPNVLAVLKAFDATVADGRPATLDWKRGDPIPF